MTQDSQSLIQTVLNQLSTVILGKEHQIRLALACLLARGHLLIEDLPGMGKTTLSHALAHTLGLSYQRVQFTSDLLPADLLGVSIFDAQRQQFNFHPGPIFSQVLLADEINRASPKTQSALLEAMAEGQISLDGHTHPLPQPFFVIATQNPLEQTGTFPLPESQLDRFLMCIALGFPSPEAEKAMLRATTAESAASLSLERLLSPAMLVALQKEVSQLHVAEPLLDYLLSLVQASRTHRSIPHPLSPRASKALLRAAQAWAFLSGRDYVQPEDVQAIFPAVAEHRLRGCPSKEFSAESYCRLLLTTVDPVI